MGDDNMKKIVINNCFGGFCLSNEGIKYFAKLKGIQELYFYKEESGEIQKVDEESSSFLVTPLTIDIGEKPTYEEYYKAIDHYYYSPEFKRDDLDLIKTIDDLGEKASGDFSNLKIVEIPDDVEWQIEEYDGNEWVAEKHRTWE